MESPGKKIQGLSLRWDRSFVRNVIIVVGVVAVWRGLWNLIDMYVFPENPLLSNIVCIAIGLLILYLPDGNIDELH